jgi:hypothetical protein
MPHHAQLGIVSFLMMGVKCYLIVNSVYISLMTNVKDLVYMKEIYIFLSMKCLLTILPILMDLHVFYCQIVVLHVLLMDTNLC